MAIGRVATFSCLRGLRHNRASPSLREPPHGTSSIRLGLSTRAGLVPLLWASGSAPAGGVTPPRGITFSPKHPSSRVPAWVVIFAKTLPAGCHLVATPPLNVAGRATGTVPNLAFQLEGSALHYFVHRRFRMAEAIADGRQKKDAVRSVLLRRPRPRHPKKLMAVIHVTLPRFTLREESCA